MKRFILGVLTVAAVTCGTFAQEEARQIPSRQIPSRDLQPQKANPPREKTAVELPKFDLDFPGGPPEKLVEFIQREVGVLNAVIPTEHKDIVLPPLRMRAVNVPQLFEALKLASRKTVPHESSSTSFGGQRVMQERVTSFGFETSGSITPESIWYFNVVQPAATPEPARIVRYDHLGRYLSEYTINDITTAIQTGWKMLGDSETLELNFHEETKLLIAVGPLSMMHLIDSVLKELGKGLPPPAQNPRPFPGQPKPE